MSIQTKTAARRASAVAQRVLDQFGVLFLLAISVTTAGATILVGG